MSKNLVRFDWAMKKLLRSKANFGILEGFLSELLNRDLKIIELLESETNKNHDNDKSNKVDILVKLDNDEIVLIEVQVSSQADYFHRMLYGTSKIITEYISQGFIYADIKKVYSVNILYFDLGHGEDYVYCGTTNFIGIHKHDRLELSEKQRELYKKESVHQIYPEYYLIKVNQFDDVAKNTLDEWIYFLKNEEIKDNFKAKGLLEAKDKLSELKLSDSEKVAYKKFVENTIYNESMLITNYKIGKIEGEQIGLEKGEQIGLEKGKIEIAKNMQKSGMSKDAIVKLTGIDIEKIVT
jgi:predicted transposase/invertase (TIGR01784 family)